jgi:small GTP-binding protein
MTAPAASPWSDFYAPQAARPTTAPPIQSTATHLSTLRTLRRQTRRPTNGHPPNKSIPLQSARAYLAAKVDPVVGKAITYILLEQPASKIEIVESIRKYFTALGGGVELEPTIRALSANSSNSTTSGSNGSSNFKSQKVKERDRIYMARQMSPFFTRLVSEVVAARPEEVCPFVAELMGRVLEEAKAEIVAEEEEKVKAAAAATAAAAAVVVAAPQLPLPPKLSILVIGPHSSGKTSLLAAISGSTKPTPKPTTGFSPSTLNLGSTRITFFDLGGDKKIRKIWGSYYHDVHAVIYVCDSAANDMTWKSDAVGLYNEALSHPFLAGKPTLIYANKSESKGCRDKDEVMEGLSIKEDGEDAMAKVVSCSSDASKRGEGLTEEPDSRIDEGLSWLLGVIGTKWDTIKSRVEADCDLEKARLVKEKEIKERQVMAKSLNKAFALNGEVETDKFSEEDGYEFLAQEIGFMKAEELVEEGREIARLVGFQKLATMMVGGMFAPISAKKKKFTWAEIKAHVLEVRAEVGMNNEGL